jgi:general secretion pathway protein D
LLALLGLVLVAGCSTLPRSQTELDSADEHPTERVSERVAEESEKLADTVDKLRDSVEKRDPEEVIEPTPPEFDSAETETITLNLVRAHIADAVRAITANSSIDLIVDPEVNQLDQRATLSLEDVTVREAIDSVLQIYDVHGRRRGNTLRLSLYEQRHFQLDFLNSSSLLENESGGNVFGDQETGIQGSQSLEAVGGSDEKPYQRVLAAIRNILGIEDPRELRVMGQEEAAAEAREQNAPVEGGEFPLAPPQRNLNDRNGPGSEQQSKREENTRVALDAVSGSLYVRARPSQVQAVGDYIQRLQRELQRQVFIEAQLIDVRLRDSFRFGIDWSILRDNFAGLFAGVQGELETGNATLPNAGDLPEQTLTIPSQVLNAGNERSLGLAYRDQNFGAVLQALDTFGNISVLSNPNLMVRNGTPALLQVGTSSRFVAESKSTQTNPGGGAQTTTVDIETDTVFSGVSVGVVPHVREDGSVEIMVRPMQSDVDESSLRLVNVGGENRVSLPEVSVKGLTTTLRLNDGDLVLIGGLIDQTTSKSDQGLPGLSRVPVLGRLAGNRETMSETRELVVALRVRVR